VFLPQIIQESIQIPGSGLYLTYQSSKMSGYLSIVRMQLTGSTIPKTLTHVHVGVEIEGSLHVKTYEADPNLQHRRFMVQQLPEFLSVISIRRAATLFGKLKLPNCKDLMLIFLTSVDGD
jgi:hypothetical protein